MPGKMRVGGLLEEEGEPRAAVRAGMPAFLVLATLALVLVAVPVVLLLVVAR
jgi:hypothetical protein